MLSKQVCLDFAPETQEGLLVSMFSGSLFHSNFMVMAKPAWCLLGMD